MKTLRNIEKFFVSIGYIVVMLWRPSYRYDKTKKQGFFDSPKIVYLDYPKKKEFFRRIYLGVFGLIIFFVLALSLVLFLSDLFF